MSSFVKCCLLDKKYVTVMWKRASKCWSSCNDENAVFSVLKTGRNIEQPRDRVTTLFYRALWPCCTGYLSVRDLNTCSSRVGFLDLVSILGFPLARAEIDESVLEPPYHWSFHIAERNKHSRRRCPQQTLRLHPKSGLYGGQNYVVPVPYSVQTSMVGCKSYS